MRKCLKPEGDWQGLLRARGSEAGDPSFLLTTGVPLPASREVPAQTRRAQGGPRLRRGHPAPPCSPGACVGLGERGAARGRGDAGIAGGGRGGSGSGAFRRRRTAGFMENL